MANKLAIVVGSVALFIIALLLFQGHNLKRQLKESQEDLADEKVRSKRSQRQNVDYESRIRDLEVALRQKTEQQNTAQADLDEAEQQIQEKTDFLKEVQQALEAMAVRFSIDIDAEETLATTVIQMISDRLQETINGLRKESAAAKELAQKHASSVENAEESKGQLQSDLDEARKKAENAVKDLEQLKNDYKKLNTVIKALIAAGDTNNDELKKQQEAVDKQAKAVDDKLKTVATPAPTKPATNPPTPAPTTPAPTPTKVEKADDTYGADNAGDTANNQADENADDAGEHADENADENTENDTAKVDTGADANADANADGGDETAEKPAADKKATYTASSGQALPQKKGKEEDYGTN